MAFRNDQDDVMDDVMGTEPAVPQVGDLFAIGRPVGTRIVREVESVQLRDADGLLECVVVSEHGARWLLVEQEEPDGATRGRWRPATPLPADPTAPR